MKEIYNNWKVCPAGRIFYFWLKDKEGGKTYKTNKEIAKYFECHPDTLCRWIRELVDQGYIKVKFITAKRYMGGGPPEMERNIERYGICRVIEIIK